MSREMASFLTENFKLGILTFQSGFRFLILSKKNLIPVFSGDF
jgi:hypothetical protein